MTERSGRSIAIAGAGLAGSLMAAMTAVDGYDVTVYERRSDPRAQGAEEGRSINLALSHRGIRALDEIGVTKAVLAEAVPMRGRLMHSVSGGLTLQPYGTSADQVIHSVSRSGLNRLLVDAAEAAGARIHFERPIYDVDIDNGTVKFAKDEGVQHDFIIGADGAYSRVRGRMQRRAGFNYEQSYLPHGYKELSMPARDGRHAMEANALHIWPRGGYMMIALPNADGTYTCTLFWPLDGPVSFASVDSPGQIEGLFQREFPDVPALIPDLVEQYQTNPVGSLVTIRCSPWNYGERTLLIGDAAHAVVPFYGQGMNASFEDCRLLREAMREAPTPSAAFERFAAERPEDTDALADLAIDNYVTMRDRVASKAFLVRRTIGRLAHRILPSVFVPLYTLVTFTSLPYAEAAARWDRQARMARIAGVLLVSLALFVLLVSLRGQ